MFLASKPHVAHAFDNVLEKFLDLGDFKQGWSGNGKQKMF